MYVIKMPTYNFTNLAEMYAYVDEKLDWCARNCVGKCQLTALSRSFLDNISDHLRSFVFYGILEATFAFEFEKEHDSILFGLVWC